MKKMFQQIQTSPEVRFGYISSKMSWQPLVVVLRNFKRSLSQDIFLDHQSQV